MDIKCRQFCDKCGGTGKNALDDLAALRKAVDEQNRYPGGVLMPGALGPRSTEQRARELQKCGYCENGYNEFWLDLNEVLSRGV